MNPEIIIRASNLTKQFNSFTAVDNIEFQIEKGSLFGLLGPNGAGKTTTIRMLTGILKPSAGRVSIGGHDIQKNSLEAKQLMGIVPEMTNAYMDLSPLQNLSLIGELYGIAKDERIKRAQRLLDMFNLTEKGHHEVKTLSKGLQQRVVVAMALMNDAQVLFLDEPTSGLDVESARLIRDIIVKAKNKGTTILLTTHNIQEADQLCDTIAIMNRGKIVAIERPENLKRIVKSSMSVEVAFSENTVKVPDLDGVNHVEQKGDRYKLYTDRPEDIIPQLVEYAHKQGTKIISLNTMGADLEDVFLQLTQVKNT
ncbi:MAG: ATP-binding cassette domain-containing protein [Theionarchaea archaeon]|nr:ATP-binding cassette domain-containing protein [Theionarchaea archaeon]